ncbi:hypothetical protein [Chryseobacterium indoltheticum]|uniref:Peptide modification target n=1 Tax=Chryseobacterium indoltheticum TaxID=254 RepID=A0A381FRS1_9FLAO|nr:hypothetical protein [Chryseobacterium indoltheticum]AZA63031.1 hypothetical protein EG340_19270 [Chryseobacterium indoltheticum]SUX48871.1 Uncharacterised protein [Chryseobacterium indoltheticum]
MKKQTQKEKKLSLKKLQITKINNMKTVYGGNGDTTYGNSYTRTQTNVTQELGFGDNDDPVTKPRTLGGGL